MRKRIKQTLVYITIALICLVCIAKLFGLYFSKERARTETEYGLHYGPSEKILLEYEDKGNYFVVTQMSDGSIATIGMKHVLGVAWQIMWVFSPREIGDGDVGSIGGVDDILYGVAHVPEAAFVELLDENGEIILRLPVFEDGVFFSEGTVFLSELGQVKAAFYTENGEQLCYGDMTFCGYSSGWR